MSALRIHGPVVLVLAAALVGVSPRLAHSQCPHRDSWPTSTWPSRTEQYATARATEIAAFEDYAFTLEGADTDRKGLRTDAVVMVQDGAIVYERYGRGFEAHHRHISWSVAKSFTNALVGVAVHQGRMDITDSICDYVEPVRPENCDLQVLHLLQMGSGFDWAEEYEGSTYQNSSVIAMLYGQGRRDMAAFVMSHPRRDPPGTTFLYSTGESVLLAATAVGAMTDALGERWPWDLIFDPIGMDSAIFERDPAGTFAGGSFVFATPRDYARMGFLWLNDGCWDGERLLPEGWMADSTTVNDAYLSNDLDDGDGVYGRQFWLNWPLPQNGDEKPWQTVPEDGFAALGHWGQSILVVPSEDLIVVRTADDRDDSFDRDQFYELALAVGRAL